MSYTANVHRFPLVTISKKTLGVDATFAVKYL